MVVLEAYLINKEEVAVPAKCGTVAWTLAVLLVALLSTSPAFGQAKTVYVDDSNISGIENGTLAYPYNTINEGVTAATVGSTIRGAAGLYNETVAISRRTGLTISGAGGFHLIPTLPCVNAGNPARGPVQRLRRHAQRPGRVRRPVVRQGADRILRRWRCVSTISG